VTLVVPARPGGGDSGGGAHGGPRQQGLQAGTEVHQPLPTT